VYAWDLPGQLDRKELNYEYYHTLMLRAASSILQPFGISEERLAVLVNPDKGEQLSLLHQS
jgi:hypothetical protein